MCSLDLSAFNFHIEGTLQSRKPVPISATRKLRLTMVKLACPVTHSWHVARLEPEPRALCTLVSNHESHHLAELRIPCLMGPEAGRGGCESRPTPVLPHTGSRPYLTDTFKGVKEEGGTGGEPASGSGLLSTKPPVPTPLALGSRPVQLTPGKVNTRLSP